MREIQNKQVTTRRVHNCAWCGEQIQIGEAAQYRVYIFDGFQTDYLHPECKEAMNTYPDYLGDGFIQGEFKRGSHDER